jgi:hypothetical protein
MHVIHVTNKWSDDPEGKDFDLLKLFWYELTPQLSSPRDTTSSGLWPVLGSKQPALTFENTREHSRTQVGVPSWLRMGK